MPAPVKKHRRPTAAQGIFARLLHHISLDVDADRGIVARFDEYAVPLGKFSLDAFIRAEELRTGLPLGSLKPQRHQVDAEVEQLIRRLARRGLLEYRFGHARDATDLVVIEPQVPDYWPQTPKLGDADILVLSRFAYLRRRGQEMVLESPRAGALFRICDPKVAAALALLSTPQPIKKFRRQNGFPGNEILALLMDCRILLKVENTSGDSLREAEGDDNLVLWDFHDLLFHTRSTEGRQANPLGGLYPYADRIAPPPATRPSWPGKKIDLRKFSNASSAEVSPLVGLLRERHSTRDFDDQQPITLTELSRFLANSAQVQSTWKSRVDLGKGSPTFAYTSRPYPAAGSAYELELYLSVGHCEGLARGFYHYDPGQHALVAIDAQVQELDAQLASAAYAMDASGPPQILVTMAARFNRISWKYSSIAYSLILKDVGVLIQTLYLMATDMGLGGCAIGSANIDLFAKMTGLEFHVEGPVGLFAMGRGLPLNPSG